ncbi:MAG TPA: hypothetical protein VFI46_00255 [Jiangellaceae bacterium]|nr:hypothetical protein [Jiangellaceae bacterium]
MHEQHGHGEVSQSLTHARVREVTGEVRAQLPVHDIVDRSQPGVQLSCKTLGELRVGKLGRDTELPQLCRQHRVNIRLDVPPAA